MLHDHNVGSFNSCHYGDVGTLVVFFFTGFRERERIDKISIERFGKWRDNQ